MTEEQTRRPRSPPSPPPGPSSSTAAWARCCRTGASTTAAPVSCGTSSVPMSSATRTGRTPRRARACSPPTPSAAPVPAWRCTGSATGCTSSTRPAPGWRARRPTGRSAGGRRPRPDRRAVGPARRPGTRRGAADVRRAARGLGAGGIDLVLIETMSDLAEVEAAVAAAREIAPELPVVVTFSFDTNLHTMMGVRPATRWPRWRQRGGRGRRQLRSRPGRDGRDRRPDGRGASRGAAAGRPVQRRSAPGRRRPLRVRRDARRHGAPRSRAARPRHRPDRCLLRLDAGARRRHVPALS